VSLVYRKLNSLLHTLKDKNKLSVNRISKVDFVVAEFIHFSCPKSFDNCKLDYGHDLTVVLQH
jgi:hypothetical protein